MQEEIHMRLTSLPGACLLVVSLLAPAVPSALAVESPKDGNVTVRPAGGVTADEIISLQIESR